VAVTALNRVEIAQDDKPERNIEQGQADDHQAHHRAAAEGDAQAAVERFARSFSGARRGIGCGLHAEKTGQTGEEAAGQECDRHPAVLHLQHEGHKGEQNDQADKDKGNHLVLLLQISHGAGSDIGGDLRHALAAFAGLFHLPVKKPGEDEGRRRTDRRQPEELFSHCNAPKVSDLPDTPGPLLRVN